MGGNLPETQRPVRAAMHDWENAYIIMKGSSGGQLARSKFHRPRTRLRTPPSPCPLHPYPRVSTSSGEIRLPAQVNPDEVAADVRGQAGTGGAGGYGCVSI